MVRTLKPTGDADCPPHINRAHEIDNQINEKASTRELNDSDIIDVDDTDNEVPSNQEMLSGHAKAKVMEKGASGLGRVKSEKASGPIARRLPSDCLPSTPINARNASRDLLSNITNALDPRSRQARDDERSIATMQSQQIFTLSSQLRETQRQVDTLHQQLTDAECHRNDAERRADCEQMLRVLTKTQHHSSSVTPSSTTPISSQSSRAARPRRQCHARERHDVYYKEGGGSIGSVQWVYSDDDYNYGENDSPGTRRIVTRCSDTEDEVSGIAHDSEALTSSVHPQPLEAQESIEI